MTAAREKQPGVSRRTGFGRGLFTTGQIADVFQVAPRTVTKWIDSKRLVGFRIPGSNDRRVYHSDLVLFAARAGFRLPPGVAPARRLGVWLDPRLAAACGLEPADPFAAVAAAVAADAGLVLVGSADGLASALALGAALAQAAPHVRRACVVGPERSAEDVPAGAFARVFAADPDPLAVAAWLAEGGAS